MMVPQKFLMMKCVRILLLLHIIGIVFVAYKIYSSTVNQSGSDSVSANAYFNRRSDKSVLSKKTALLNNEDDGLIAETVNEEDYIESDNDANDEGDNDDKLQIETLVEDDDDPVAGDITQRDEGKQKSIPYRIRNENRKEVRRPALNPVVSMQSSKSKEQSLTAKKAADQPLPPPQASSSQPHWTILYAGKYSKTLYSPPPNERPTQRLPQAIVIGSPHSGIRPLVDFLELHPQIVPIKRETSFFDGQNRLQFFTKDFLSQMPLSYTNQVTVVRTEFSRWTRKSICELYARSKTLKVIAVLRDPVSRILAQVAPDIESKPVQLLVAQHGDALRVNNDTESVDLGRYVEYLKMWTQCFPRSQIHIVEWNDIMQQPALSVHLIEGFLGVPYKLKAGNFYRDEAKRVYCIRPLYTKSKTCMSQKRGKYPELTPQAKNLIYRFYSKHNEELFKLLGQRYQWGPST